MEDKFYFMFRRNKEPWAFSCERPFLTNYTSSNIIGQYISSTWFQQRLVFGDSYDCSIENRF